MTMHQAEPYPPQKCISESRLRHADDSLGATSKASASEMAYLRVISGPNPGEVIELSPEGVILGRNPECTIILEHGAVSRMHARIVYEGGVYVIEDLDSRNGTQVNGELQSRTKLSHADQIKICAYKFAFEETETSGGGGCCTAPCRVITQAELETSHESRDETQIQKRKADSKDS